MEDEADKNLRENVDKFERIGKEEAEWVAGSHPVRS
jgi:hypothetical protein